MKLNSGISRAMTLVETMVTSMLIGVVFLGLYAVLNMGTILGAKNLAVNVAHEQARVAMLQMMQDFHSSVSLPAVTNDDGTTSPAPTPATSAPFGYPGVAFQLWAIGPLRIAADALTNQNVVQVTVPAGTRVPVVGERLIVRTHQLEDDITAVSGAAGGTVSLTLAHNLSWNPATNQNDPARSGITGTSTNHIVCFITDRCSYFVDKNKTLNWNGPNARKAISMMANTITDAAPFTIKTSPLNAPLYQVVPVFDLSTADAQYTNLSSRTAFRSANILLHSEVPMRARLTDTQ
jgi:hypothetical protein